MTDTPNPTEAQKHRSPYWEDPDYQDWLNELGENIPDSYDDDVAMEAIVLRYVRDLEARADTAEAIVRKFLAVEALTDAEVDALRALAVPSPDTTTEAET